MTESTVTPVPENAAVTPSWKPEPDTTTARDEAPWPSDDGDSDVAAGSAMTVKADDVVCVPASVFVSVRLRAPAAAELLTVTLTVACDESVTNTELTVTPVPENDADIPDTKPVPVTVMFCDTEP